MKIKVVFACRNRAEQTLRCIRSLTEGAPGCAVSFLILDDGSTDRTVPGIEALGLDAVLLHGEGNLFWAGGMRRALDFFLARPDDSDYLLLVNDDVEFYPGAVPALVRQSRLYGGAVLAGAVEDAAGRYTYGGFRVSRAPLLRLFEKVPPGDAGRCDTFNCNCVLLPREILLRTGSFDPVFTHSMADLDYGLRISRAGWAVHLSSGFVGRCEANPAAHTWKDRSLGRLERLRKKESPKGVPAGEWFYFVRRHFGLPLALRYSATPYLRILLGR